MTSREALQELIYVAPLSEEDKARILALVPEMTQEEVLALGSILAEQELMYQNKLDTALAQIDANITQAQMSDASAG